MVERINILGVGVSAVDPSMALAAVDEWISRGEPHYICVNTGVHGIMESYRQGSRQRDPQLQPGLLFRMVRAVGVVEPTQRLAPYVMLSACTGPIFDAGSFANDP